MCDWAQHLLAGRCLVLWPPCERPVGEDVFRKEDVMPCGHILQLWRSVVDRLEAGAECLIVLVKNRVLQLAAECGPVPHVCFHLRQLGKP